MFKDIALLLFDLLDWNVHNLELIMTIVESVDFVLANKIYYLIMQYKINY